MNAILLRIRKVFSDSGKSQTEIGKILSKTPQYVWRILNVDDLSPSDSVIKDICREFNINYDWLTKGIEPMYEQTDISSMARIDAIMTGENEFAKNLFKEFSKLDEKEWEVLEKLINNLQVTKKDV